MSNRDHVPRKRYRIAGLLIGVLAIAGLVIVIANGVGVPELSSVGTANGTRNCLQDDADGCLVFPSISGLNLNGDTFNIPEDFAGDVVAVAIPFDDAQQFEVADWLPAVEALQAEFEGFAYYNVAVFPEIDPAVRLIIRGGMIMGLNAEQRAVTITAFLDDRDAFVEALRIADIGTLHIVLLNANHEVIWRESGAFTQDKADALRDGVQRTLAP